MNKSQKAIEYFAERFNCCQSVLASLGPRLDLDEKTCLKLAAPFAAGMGYKGDTCGAVVGGYLAIGLLAGYESGNNETAKNTTYYLLNKYLNEFKKIHGCTHCRDLLGIDISIPENLEKARDDELFQTKCVNFVKDSAMILEKIIDEYGKKIE